MPEYRGPSVQIPAEQLETLLDRRAEQQQRPRPTPRDVLAIWMGNALAGLGAGIVVGVGMLALVVVLRSPRGWTRPTWRR